MKHVIIILIFIMLSLGITAFILDMTKNKEKFTLNYIKLTDPNQTCGDINMIPVDENDCLNPNVINEVKQIINTDNRFKKVSYGTIVEEKKGWNEIPKGCSFYLDPISPQYNRVVFNTSSNGPTHNQAGVGIDGCDWCKRSSSYKICFNQNM